MVLFTSMEWQVIKSCKVYKVYKVVKSVKWYKMALFTCIMEVNNAILYHFTDFTDFINLSTPQKRLNESIL